MDIDKLYNANDKEPLERIISDGGFCGIFRTIGCIGDSLASGEFEGTNDDGERTYHDFYEYSWGQYMARTIGNKVYNFSRGGMTAKRFCDAYGPENGCFLPEKACQAYIIALGVNDMGHLADVYGECGFGDTSDIDMEDCEKNKASFLGHYAKIIQRMKKIQPKAKFFLITMPKESYEAEISNETAVREKHREALYKLSEIFDNTYVLDIRKYGPVYDDEFGKKFKLGGHLNAMGYIFTAKMVISYIDFIIRHNMEDFLQVGFIGTPYHNKNVKW